MLFHRSKNCFSEGKCHFGHASLSATDTFRQILIIEGNLLGRQSILWVKMTCQLESLITKDPLLQGVFFPGLLHLMSNSVVKNGFNWLRSFYQQQLLCWRFKLYFP